MFIRAQDGIVYNAQTIQRIDIENAAQPGHHTNEADPTAAPPAQSVIFARLSGQQGSVRLSGPYTEDECRQVMAQIVAKLGGVDLMPAPGE